MNRRGFLRFLGLAPMGVAAAAAMPTVPQPAHGGLVPSKPYLVGERGCEMVIPKSRNVRIVQNIRLNPEDIRPVFSVPLNGARGAS